MPATAPTPPASYVRRALGIAVIGLLVVALLWIGWAGQSRGTAVYGSRDPEDPPIRRGENVLWSAEPETPIRFADAFPATTNGILFRFGPMPGVGERRVSAFGYGARRGGPVEAPESGVDDYVPGSAPPALEQVRLRWHDDPRAPTRFVLELRPEGGDRILLASVAPEDTLRATWDAVERRIAGIDAPLPAFDGLAIPRIHVSFLPRFGHDRVALWTDELRLDGGGRRPALPPSAPDLTGIADVPALPSYVFDRPFLVARLRRDETAPSLLLWVGNAELLEPVR